MDEAQKPEFSVVNDTEDVSYIINKTNTSTVTEEELIPEFSTVTDTEDVSDIIKKTNASTATGEEQLKEIEIFLDDLVGKIIETFKQTGQYEEPAAVMKNLLKEINKPLEIFKRIKSINIVQYLDGKRRVNVQTLEKESTSEDSLVLKDSVEDCVHAVLENIVKEVENENPESGQSESIKSVAETETDINYAGFKQDLLKERKMIDEIEQIVNNLIKEIETSSIDSCLEITNEKPVEEFELPLDKKSQQSHQSADSTTQSTSVSSGQNANTFTESLHQSRPLADSFQYASIMANEQIGEPSLAEAIMMDCELSDIVEKAYRMLSHQGNPKVRRAATLVNRISERSMHHLADNLSEVDGMIEIIDGIGDLNEYLHMDIRKIFLLQRSYKRISSYITEHLATISMCRTEKFFKKEAVHVRECGFCILNEIKVIKSQISTLFKHYFLIQRSFLNQSLKITTIPFEWLIGDGRFTLLMYRVKIAVIRLCGAIFSMKGLDDLHQIILSKCKDISGLVNVFTAFAVVVDHKRDKFYRKVKNNDKKNGKKNDKKNDKKN